MITSGMLVVVFLCVIPFVAAAQTQTQAEIEAEIQSLLAQLAEVQAALAALQGNTAGSAINTSSAGCPALARSVAFGARGNDVQSLQTFLIAEGVLAAGNATGYFGPLTEAAVQAWQATHGVVSSGTPASTGFGVAGPKTRAAIQAACSSAPPNNTPAAPASPALPASPAATPATSPSIAVTAPRDGAVASGGSTLRIAWESTNVPAGARVSLTLLGAGGARVQTLASNLPVSGEYSWSVPHQSSGGCGPNESAIDCIARIAACAGGASCTLDAGTYAIETILSSFARATSGAFRIGGAPSSSSIYDSLFNAAQGQTSTSNASSTTNTNTNTTGTTASTTLATPGSCVHEGQLYPPGTTLSSACTASNCPYASGAGFITASCAGGQWCIPQTAYCSLSISTINVSTSSSSGSNNSGNNPYAIGCPREGYRAYLSCPHGGCVTGWNTCRNGAWVRDTEQQVVQVGTQGPCQAGSLWCAIDTLGSYGCVPAAACINGSAASTSQ